MKRLMFLSIALTLVATFGIYFSYLDSARTQSNFSGAQLYCFVVGPPSDWQPCSAINPLQTTGGAGGGTVTPIPNIQTTTITTFAPTATMFSNALALNASRKSCTIVNLGTTQGHCNYNRTSLTTSNTLPVNANGGQFVCQNPNGSLDTAAVACTCDSGTCSFVVNEQQ